MQIIIGGSPSTGSSLLRQMLNRHSSLYCGPETKLFVYPALYEHWDKLKSGLVRMPYLTAPDVHMVRGSNLSGQEQVWSEKEVARLIKNSRSLREFAMCYFRKPCHANNKQYWAEKTPANVLSFRQFHGNFELPVVLHIVRHPLDTIASLRSRGLPLYQAVSRYLFSTAYGFAARELENYVEVQYEQLVSSPEKALKDFFRLTGLDFEDRMLSTGNPEMAETHKMAGWTHSETDRPGTSAVGRYAKLSEQEQGEILQAVACMEISEKFASKNGIDHLNIATMAELLNYSLPGTIEVSVNMRRRLSRSRLSRMMFTLAERRSFLVRERPIVVR